jgi:protease-4
MDDGRTGKRRRRLWVIALIALLIGFWMSRSWWAGPAVPEGSYVLLDLQGDYAERAPEGVLERLLGEPTPSLFDVLTVIRDAAEDERIAGMVVRVRSLEIGWAKAQDIRDALLRFRDSGKPLRAYLEQEFANSTLEYYVASAADTIDLPPAGTAPVSGLLGQYVFLGGVWDKLDIEMNVEKIREYKTFGDMIANKRMSTYQREMENSLLDSLYSQVVSGIANDRNLDPHAVRAAIDASPASAEELQKGRLADGVHFLDQLRTELLGEKREFLPAAKYRASGGFAPQDVWPDGKIAVVYGVGPIITGKSESSVVTGRIVMGSDTIVEAFRKASEDDDIKAIVFRIDSPGGSALASDLIWRATRSAGRAKPVIVSMSDVAGSGGYYVAAGATRIVAQPGTLTGSIGVVVTRPDVSGFLAKLGINTESLKRGDLADLGSLTTPLTAGARARLVESMQHIYDVFVQRVSEGRGLSPQRVDEIGRGRVWTGEQALANGLVDETGGFFAALDAAKTAAGIPVSRKVELVFYPKRKGLGERLMELFSTRIFGPPPAWWQRLRGALGAFEFPAGSILTMMRGRFELG